jgi:hypothetical protein
MTLRKQVLVGFFRPRDCNDGRCDTGVSESLLKSCSNLADMGTRAGLDLVGSPTLEEEEERGLPFEAGLPLDFEGVVVLPLLVALVLLLVLLA